MRAALLAIALLLAASMASAIRHGAGWTSKRRSRTADQPGGAHLRRDTDPVRRLGGPPPPRSARACPAAAPTARLHVLDRQGDVRRRRRHDRRRHRGRRQGAVRRVPATGFNAMELTTYSHTASKRRGECHGVAAANRLEQLLRQRRWRRPARRAGPAQRHRRPPAPSGVGQDRRPLGRRRPPHDRRGPCAVDAERRRVGVEPRLRRPQPPGGRRRRALWDTHGCGTAPRRR